MRNHCLLVLDLLMINRKMQSYYLKNCRELSLLQVDKNPKRFISQVKGMNRVKMKELWNYREKRRESNP